MGFFRSLKKKVVKATPMRVAPKIAQPTEPKTTETADAVNQQTSELPYPYDVDQSRKFEVVLSASMSSLGDLIESLASCDETETSGQIAATTLHTLFSLSETAENRMDMVHFEQERLVPVLLNFLSHCKGGSSEQYLALLILNNVSMPAENKRFVALECQAAKILAQMLCDDPSCHMIAIILTNLTFTDADLRRDLVHQPLLELVEALAFALRVSSLTQAEMSLYEKIQASGSEQSRSPSQMLARLLADDGGLNESANGPLGEGIIPNMPRWCLTSLKNLSRPSKDSIAADAIVRSGIVPHILRFLEFERPLPVSTDSVTTPRKRNNSPTSLLVANAPTTWVANTAPDAALFCLIHLASVPHIRLYLLTTTRAVEVLVRVTDFATSITTASLAADDLECMDMQILKARMVLSYLLGSHGHFGQPLAPAVRERMTVVEGERRLIVSDVESALLLELLSDVVHCRASAVTGHSLNTFSVKLVVLAIRCLLTTPHNVELLNRRCGTKLNILLLKIVALHAIDQVRYIDVESAEYAVFSLYLLSNRGMQSDPFLPESFADAELTQSDLAKILVAYWRAPNTTAAGSHAADQLLLRHAYLHCSGDAPPYLLSPANNNNNNFDLSSQLRLQINKVPVGNQRMGAEPCAGILDRPVLGLQQRGAVKEGDPTTLWSNDDAASVIRFASALDACQAFSFGSQIIRHVEPIDDIKIANNIAACASGERNVAYGYLWKWADVDSSVTMKAPKATSFLDSLSLGLGALCGLDTSVR